MQRHQRDPRTAAEKARISLKTLTHAIASAPPVLPGENNLDREGHCTAIVDALAPVGTVETALAERGALAATAMASA